MPSWHISPTSLPPLSGRHKEGTVTLEWGAASLAFGGLVKEFNWTVSASANRLTAENG